MAATLSASGDVYRKLAFRFRVFIFLALYLLGFFTPWSRLPGITASSGTLWLAASTLLARTGWIALDPATLIVTFAALFSLAAAAILRVWGTAYLGAATTLASVMQGGRIVAAGPYRYLRNPLYLGSWLQALGLSILMPPDGAFFLLVAFSIFTLFLISAEEQFLARTQGDVYRQYLSLVPRLLPRISAAAARSSACPQWLHACVAENFSIAYTLCFAVFAWRYNARILLQCLLICYGFSLIIRALRKKPSSGNESGHRHGSI